MTVLSINIQEHDLEATETLWAEACAVQLVLIAHDILEHLSATFLVKQVLPLPGSPVFVLFSQEVEEGLLLVASDAVGHKGLEQILQILKRETATLRTCDDKLKEADKAIDVILVCDRVTEAWQEFFPTCFFSHTLVFFEIEGSHFALIVHGIANQFSEDVLVNELLYNLLAIFCRRLILL